MFNILLIVSKYLYLGIIGLFVIFSIIQITNERGITNYKSNYNKMQFRLIIIFNILSAIILFNKNEYAIRYIIGLTIVIYFFKVALFRVYSNSCDLLWNIVLFFINLGNLVIYRLYNELGHNQLIFTIIGIGFILIIPRLFKIIPKFEYLTYLYMLGALLLIGMPYIFQEVQGGALNWTYIKIFNSKIKFQPSELAKMLYIFFLASIFRGESGKYKTILTVIICASIVGMLVMQKDLGTALIYFMTFLSMFYVGTGNLIITVIAIVISVKSATIAYNVFDHVKVRYDSWLDPFAYAFDGGYQVLQSLFSMGTYGLLGKGFNQGYPKLVPVIESDFIFDAISEEFGGIFAILLIAIYMIFFYRITNISLRSEKKYFSLICLGVGSLLYFQTALIIGGVTGVIPLTGVTLPFISAGGSSLIITIVMVAIVQWINGENYIEEYEEPRSYDYDYEKNNINRTQSIQNQIQSIRKECNLEEKENKFEIPDFKNEGKNEGIEND